jgi:pimeloyl-ACP methyl ester carboxylesterase
MPLAAKLAVHHPVHVVLGNSFGCHVAVDLAVRYPDRVRALALVGAAAGAVPPDLLEAAVVEGPVAWRVGLPPERSRWPWSASPG